VVLTPRDGLLGAHRAGGGVGDDDGLDSFIGQYTVDWQHLFGASVVATIPVIILFALIERRVVGGLTAGSIR
jgi:hypothetical protein